MFSLWGVPEAYCFLSRVYYRAAAGLGKRKNDILDPGQEGNVRRTGGPRGESEGGSLEI